MGETLPHLIDARQRQTLESREAACYNAGTMIAFRTFALVLLFGVSGCTDADIYAATGLDPYRPDRVAITGRVCTEDTSSTKFPAKVLYMFDATPDMFGLDPNSYRFCGGGSCTSGSLSTVLQRLRNLQNASLGVARIGSVSLAVAPVPPALCAPNPCDPQRYYPAKDVDVDQTINGLNILQSGPRNIANALAMAQSFIANDMSRITAGEILRTRYLLFMLFAGPPGGASPPSAADLSTLAQELKAFVYKQGALEFRLNVGVLTGGLSDADRNAAVDAYSSMAFAGDGRFREFAAPPAIDCQMEVASSGIKLMRKDIAVANLNERLLEQGPAADSDGDGLADVEERFADTPTDPRLWDTDGDGINDKLEFRAFPRQNPLDPADRPAACLDPAIYAISDADLDLLNDCEEGLLQTSATIPDTDGDGLPDALEFMAGTVPTSAEDRLLDFDGDGISNGSEVLEHTNPRTNDGVMRGAEGYRSSIVDLGLREVANMEVPVELRAVTFRSASPDVKPGAGVLRFNKTAKTQVADGRDAPADSLEWSDARWQSVSDRFVPVPVVVNNGTGVYTLEARNILNEAISVDVFVVAEWLPITDVVVTPYISVSERNCYDVRFSNIKLAHTLAARDALHPGSEHLEGTNHLLVFFTQAPVDRLDSPGISRVAEIPVRFVCQDPDDASTCARNPGGAFITLDDNQFTASVP